MQIYDEMPSDEIPDFIPRYKNTLAITDAKETDIATPGSPSHPPSVHTPPATSNICIKLAERDHKRFPSLPNFTPKTIETILL